ncbi:RsfA family transcriptional regulator [Virgibacillus flavescens]|uniref:RsfA family transcriptional regulator n=1 Tax=Virgibacillus flavescens TaxID=1611422 RepID=UPI003D333A2B
MVKVRQDAWSHEDDLLLAETVLRHIREGSTQLNAFEEVGDHLNRTSAACGFRWNAEVRNKYDHAIDLAKRQRKEKKRAVAGVVQNKKAPVSAVNVTAHNNEVSTNNHEQESLNQLNQSAPVLSMDMVIGYLKQVKKEYQTSNQSKSALERMERENESLRRQVSELEKNLSLTEKQLSTVQEDYQVFIQIMERARKMTVLEDQGPIKTPAFRMDKNGNLQQVANGTSN